MFSFPRARRPVVLGCIAAGLFGAAVGASAQTGTNGNRLIAITAVPLGVSTSYTGSGSFNFVSFKVTVSNVGGNVVNNVVLNGQGRLWPAGTSAQPEPEPPLDRPATTLPVPFDSADAPNCVPAAVATDVTCTIGQLRAKGQSGDSTSFTLFFASPTRTSAASIVEEINLRWRASYSDASNGERIDGDRGIATAPYAVEPWGQLTNEFISAVPLAGATLSTGSVDGDGLPQPADPWTTTVRVPGAVADYKQARGTERSDFILESSDLIDRRITELVIPDTNYAPAKILITLRRDFSTIRKGSKITNSHVYYTKSIDTDPSTAPDRAEVPFCSTTPDNGPYLDASNAWRPCIRSRTATPNRKVVNGKSEGYWEWVIEAYENGRYIN